MALSSLPAALLAHCPGLEGVTCRCLNAMTFQRPLGILFGENDRKNDHLRILFGENDCKNGRIQWVNIWEAFRNTWDAESTM